MIRDGADAAVSAATAVARQDLLATVCSVRLAFYEVLRRESALERLRAGAPRLDRVVRILRSREREGEGSGYDLLRAEQELAETEISISEAEAKGAKVLVDGRKCIVPGKEGGYHVGPTIIDHVTPDMAIAKEEVFGPVLAIIRTSALDEALAVENANPYGNAAAVDNCRTEPAADACAAGACASAGSDSARTAAATPATRATP